MSLPKKRGYVLLAGLLAILLFAHLHGQSSYSKVPSDPSAKTAARLKDEQERLQGHGTSEIPGVRQGGHLAPGPGTSKPWSSLEQKYPIQDFAQLPAGRPAQLPKVQHVFAAESESAAKVRLQRQAAVKKSFQRCYTSYRVRAWLRDEVMPISGGANDWYGGWAATLIDSLDTLWIMEMKNEFDEAIDAVAGIDFSPGTSTQDTINVFETNVRHLGGLLGAYDLSNDERLLGKAVEVADMIYASFDTPNRMPLTRWRPVYATSGSTQKAEDAVLSAEMGSFCLEFTRLTQLTGDAKYYDAATRITNKLHAAQTKTRLPGMFNLVFDAKHMRFAEGGTFKLGAMIDSLYEYLPKTYALLGGMSSTYRELYDKMARAAIKHTIFKPYTPDNADILLTGEIFVDDNGKFYPRLHTEHLGCFTGGMFALGGMLTENEQHVEIGRKLTEGCMWAYKNSPLGIMPEAFGLAPCPKSSSCRWNEDKYREMVRIDNEMWLDDTGVDAELRKAKVPKGFTKVPDPRYVLRPEAIESVFIIYRITGDSKYMDAAWDMFAAIDRHTKTAKGNAALKDVLVTSDPLKEDRMESYWMAETLKYFYLIFSDPDLINLDEYVLNTKGHPFRRPV